MAEPNSTSAPGAGNAAAISVPPLLCGAAAGQEAALPPAEQGGRYRSAGPLYAGTGIIGDASIEIGFQTGDGQQRQRTGISFYLRSDHIAKRYVTLII